MQNKALNEYLDQLKDLINKNDFISCIDILLEAIKFYPNDYKLKLNLGNIYKVLGDISNAKETYNSLLVTPYKIISQNNLSLLLLEEGEINESIKNAREAVAADPDYLDAKFNLSLGLFENKEYSESLKICNELLSDNTYKHRAYELKIRISQIICSWSSFDETQEILKSNQMVVHPFLHISNIIDEEANYNNAKKWSNNFVKETKEKHRGNAFEKIKLGFLCGEIRNHPTFYLIKNIFKNMKSSNISMYMFSYNHHDEEKKYIEENFEKFLDITNLSFLDARKMIENYQLDVLIDLTTIISHNRVNILDKSIAKIIISYLAFPGTTGNSIYDYILTDKTVTPEKMQKYYVEEFLYLPGSYQINNGKLNTKIKTKRQSYDLPNDSVVLGCLNQSFKLDPRFFNIWVNILEEHGKTCLWLLDEGDEMKNNIYSFINNRIDLNRIIFAEKISYEKHLQRIQHIDIALDTRIYNGHTTSIEMLQAGIPLVTLKGNHFASRVSASILNTLGVNHLITDTETEYKNKIVSLIDKDYRAAIKAEIIRKMKTSKILNNKDFSDNFTKKIYSVIT